MLKSGHPMDMLRSAAMNEIIAFLIGLKQDSPLILAVILLLLTAKYALIPANKVLRRGLDIMESYFGIHEKEIGHLMRLCDLIEEVLRRDILKKDTPKKSIWRRLIDR